MKIFIPILCLSSVPIAAFGAQYSSMYIFGDSLSDVGNVANTQDYNDAGRWSNGKVWNEYLSAMLGVDVPAKSSNYVSGESPSAGNTNFSHGGAMTSHGTTELAIPSIHQQITGSLRDPECGFDRYGVSFNPDDLVLMWGGANNLFFSGQTLIFNDYIGAGTRAANNIAENISLLIERGAKTIAVLNLPDIGKTPCYIGDTESSKNATDFSEAFNSRLELNLDKLITPDLDVQIILIDAFEIFNDILANAAKYGFENVEEQLILALDKDSSTDASKYLFYDDVHPTTAGHEVIAAAVYAALIPEPSISAILLALVSLGLCIAVRRRKK